VRTATCLNQIALLLALVAAPIAAVGQELDPRSYAASPIGANIVIAAYGNTSGDIVFDSNSAISDVHANVDQAALGVGRVFALAGRQSSVALALPYAWGDVTGKVGEQARSISRSGLADPRLRFSTLLIGGPALDRRAFAASKRRATLGASVVVIAPLGQYNPAKLINIGTNRWAFKPELGLSVPAGRWQLEGYAGIWLFEQNSNFFGGQRRSQDPIVAFQAHVSYTFRPGLWAAVDATHYSGGAVSLDGKQNAGRQDNVRLGATLSVPVMQGLSVKLSYSDGAVTRIGGDFRSIGIGWQYVWFD